MVAWKCPVCGEKLVKEERRFVCSKGHSFDEARAGYVNLLLSSAQGGHGDDKLMVRSRTDFLNRGHYDPLSRKLTELCAQAVGAGGCILDAGCGEGKYSADVLAALPDCTVLGTDISKNALTAAGKRTKKLQLAVASSAALPVEDGSVDVLLNVFSPLIPGEFARVLKSEGVLLRASPLEEHLWELKELIYDTPYPNPKESGEVEGFTLLARHELRFSIELTTNAEIQALFQMTPYYYKTSRADQEKCARAEKLTVRCAFAVDVLRPKCKKD